MLGNLYEAIGVVRGGGAASLSANRWRLPTHLPSLRSVVTRTYRLSAIDFLRRHLTSKMTHDAKLPLPAGHIAVKNYNHRDLNAFIISVLPVT